MPRRRETTGSNGPRTGVIEREHVHRVPRARRCAPLAQTLAEMEQSLLAQSAFFASMSHEIRTPLHGILGITRCCSTPTSTTSRRGSRAPYKRAASR